MYNMLCSLMNPDDEQGVDILAIAAKKKMSSLVSLAGNKGKDGVDIWVLF